MRTGAWLCRSALQASACGVVASRQTPARMHHRARPTAVSRVNAVFLAPTPAPCGLSGPGRLERAGPRLARTAQLAHACCSGDSSAARRFWAVVRLSGGRQWPCWSAGTSALVGARWLVRGRMSFARLEQLLFSPEIKLFVPEQLYSSVEQRLFEAKCLIPNANSFYSAMNGFISASYSVFRGAEFFIPERACVFPAARERPSHTQAARAPIRPPHPTAA